MASLPLRHRSKAILSSVLRSSAHSRAFSASARSKAPITDFIVSVPSAAIDAIHGLGIPYYAAIPLTAVLVRGAVGYWLALKPSRERAIKQSILYPLMDARQRHFPAVPPSIARSPPSRAVWTFKQASGRFREYWRSSSRYQKIFPYSSSGWGFLNFGIFLAFVESLRLKCGRSEGLLSMLLKPFERLAGNVSENASQDVSQTVDPAEALAERLKAAYEARLAQADGGGVIDLSSTRATADAILAGDHPISVHLEKASLVDTSSPWYDPALAAEGLSWCTNLTLVDPTNTLGITCVTLLFTSAIFRPPPNPRSNEAESINPAIRKQAAKPFSLIQGKRFGMIGAAVFSTVVINLPAAILLYIIPDITTRYLQSRYLDFKYPVRPVIARCKRPLIESPKREWEAD